MTAIAVIKTLESILSAYRSSIVNEMLTAWGQNTNSLKRENLVTLSQYFASTKHLEQVTQTLSEHEKYVLSYFHQYHGQSSLRRLQTRLAFVLPDQFTWLDVTKPHPKTKPVYDKKKGKPSLHDVLAGLARKGLVFSSDPITPSGQNSKSVVDWSPGAMLFLSPAVKPYLAQLDLPTLPSPTAVEPAYVRAGSVSSFLRNLIRFTRFVERKKTLSFTTQGVLYKNDLRELADELSFEIDTSSGKRETDSALLFFIRRMTREVELVTQQKYDFNGDMTPNPASDFRQAPVPEQIKRCFNAWYKGEMWHELTQLPRYAGGINLSTPARKDFIAVRKIVLDYLPQNGDGWQLLSTLTEDIREEAYQFLFEGRKFSGSYNWRTRSYEVETAYKSSNNRYSANFNGIKDEQEGWGKVEADLINHIIAGPLYWLGLVDLGYNSEPPNDPQGNKTIVAYRLNEYGRWLLDQGSKPEASQENEGTVIIQPNFELTVMGQVSDETLLTLDLFSQVLKEQEYTSTFKLTRQTIYAAQKLGWGIERILTYLEEISDKPVPQNVRRSLEEWGALHERITIRRGVQLIDTAEEKIAAEIASNPSFADWRRVTPTAFLTDAPPQTILKALDEARWLPLRTPAGNTVAANSIVITDEGEVSFTQPTPSIYAKGLLQGLSAEADHGRGLTPALIKNAVMEDSLETVINRLQQLHRGPLSQKLVIRLKSWSNYYGPASLQTFTLVEFSSAAVRNELLVDPELGEYLTQFEAHGRALAIVHPDHIQTVLTILKERNVKIKE